MIRKNLISIIIVIASFAELSPVQLQAQRQKGDISINLTILQPLKLVKDEIGKLAITGSVQIKLYNNSNKKIAILNLHEHNLLFSSKKTTEKYIPFHSCSCVLFKKQRPEFIILDAGESKTILFSNWACDGSSFGSPKRGSYKLYFRILKKSNLNRNSSYTQFRLKRDTGIREIIKDCRNLFNDKNFWKVAFYSNSVLVKF